ncbi:DcaP family trimeric outer membrane transporter [Fretibacter rubidus]|uniref:DcaP family trimeric outer membrane transporter n=1 Tax=Fretibacter rubidus TaxID=570162 RepID=UPI00352AB137
MYTVLKMTFFASLALSTAPAALAQSSTIEARLQAMESEIALLKAELAAEKAKGESDVILLEQKIQQPLPVGSAQGNIEKAGFQVGDTTFRIGGYVDLDTHVTHLSDGAIGSSSIARDFYIPSVTPVANGDGQGTTTTDLTAQATRFSISAQRGSGAETATAHIEMDFLGSLQGNERVSNSFSPRLRRAYLDYKGFRIGQEWSTFQNTSAIPESASFLVLSDGMTFMRQPMIRYTNGNFQFALESGDATITPAGGSGRIEADSNVIPDVIARYNLKGDFGNISLAAIGRQLRLESGLTDESTFGFGVSASGRINVGEKGDIRFNAIAGEGLGRYVGLNALNGAAFNPITGNVEAIPSYGGLIAYRHPVSQTGRFNIGYSALLADNPDFLTALNPRSTKSVQSAYAAYLWDIAPKITVGIEGLYGIKTLEDDSSGNISRFTFSTKYSF